MMPHQIRITGIKCEQWFIAEEAKAWVNQGLYAPIGSFEKCLLEHPEAVAGPPAAIPSAELVYLHIWLPYFRSDMREVYVKKSVTIPQWLDLLAKKSGLNFSAALVRGIKEELGIRERKDI